LLIVAAVCNSPAYAILGLPDNFNSNNSSTTSESTAETQTINGFSLYQNDIFVFTIQYPSDWKIDE
jgi:hypothetical protein